MKYAGEARQFTGEIEDFGPLAADRKKAIKKGLKVMCRETRMAVAAAQLALADAGFAEAVPDPEMIGVVLGSDYMLTMPEDYEGAMKKCADGGDFEFTRWGNDGLDQMAPLWMLKYLPNMPASHIAIYNDLRGPNNSLTMREAASNLAIGEAFRTIQRGHANAMVAGATGTRILPMQAIHALQTEQMAAENCDPTKASRPFDKNRTGMVAGEGAGMVVLEELATAKARGATIYAEVIGLGSSNVADEKLRGKCDVALAHAIRSALRDAGTVAGRHRPYQCARPRHDGARRGRGPSDSRSVWRRGRQGAGRCVEELLRQSWRWERHDRIDRERARDARGPIAARAEL